MRSSRLGLSITAVLGWEYVSVLMIAMDRQYINPKFPLWVHVIRYNTGVVVSQLVVDREGNARFKFKIIDLKFF
jgi:uncharacterized protein YpmS